MAAFASEDSSQGKSLGETAQLRCRGRPPAPTYSGLRDAAACASSASTALTTSGISAARTLSCEWHPNVLLKVSVVDFWLRLQRLHRAHHLRHERRAHLELRVGIASC